MQAFDLGVLRLPEFFVGSIAGFPCRLVDRSVGWLFDWGIGWLTASYFGYLAKLASLAEAFSLDPIPGWGPRTLNTNGELEVRVSPPNING